jgi:hypothetical protein
MAFKEWILISTQPRSNTMQRNEVAITYRSATTKNKSCNYCVTFNGELSVEAHAKGYNALSVSQDDITGEIAFVLRKDKNGLPLRLTGIKKNSNTKGNLICCNKELVKRLFAELGLQINNRYVLTISENKSVREDVMFFLIIKKVL